MVLVGHPQPPAADDRGGTHGQTPLERHPPLVPDQDRQWHHGSHQQPRPSRQSEGPRLPFNPQPEGDHLSNRRQARTRLTHMSQRRAVFFMNTLALFHGGTCFFLRFERGIIGVTANHVVNAYESAAAANPNTVCQLRNSPAFDLVGAIIARDAARDIATFAVSEAVLSHIEAIPLDCRASWPPPEPQHLWLLSVCGFPETMRTSRADRSAEFGAWGALAAVECVTRDEILITYDPA